MLTGWEGPAVSFGLNQVLEAFKSLKRRGLGSRDRKLLSSVIRELLKVDPDITQAEATLAAIEATGAKPSAELLRVKGMLNAVKARPGRKMKAAKKAVAYKKKAAPKRASRRKRRAKRERRRIARSRR